MGHRILYIPKPVTQIYYPEYGLLYNWPAATDARKISSSDDWVVPQSSQWTALSTYLGGNSVAGGKMKEYGLGHWDSPNYNATNESGFNGRGSGKRLFNGGFFGLRSHAVFWNYDEFWFPNTDALISEIFNEYEYADIRTESVIYTLPKISGLAIRLLYTGTGTPTSYTGNDGKVYRVVTVGTQTFLADNLAETRFRNNDIIPWYGANPANYFTNAEWAALTTAGCCAYNNTLSNVGPGFSFPT